MFLPVSSPVESIELVCESVVGRHDPLKNLRYAVQPLSSDEGKQRRLSEAALFILNSRGTVSGLARSNASFLHGAGQKDLENRATPSNDITLAAAVRQAIRESLHSVDRENPKTPVTSIAKHDSSDAPDRTASDEQETINIHSLGENDETVLQRETGNMQLPLTDDEVERVGLNSFVTPAEAASKQNVFDLSKVFDPKNRNDVELFGWSDDEGDLDDRDEKLGDGMLHLLKEQNEGNNTDLDDELDAIIGPSYGVWDKVKVQTTKWRTLERKRATDDEAWASEDKLDVSDFAELVPYMAIEYPFNLDVFQRRAVYRLERDENVFVAAHTSAGKTVVAEYAIALAMQRRTKVVYTSPIKTLSNQKFRDFTERFKDVGIITGDISINPEASCLVMTTEILRSMLYKGADLVRDLSHVIFDECHWLNDPERGVVWEEAIILLPPAVNIVMLSATVPNAMDFAKWVGRTKQKPVYVVHTPKRPVPLSHQLFVKGEVYPLFDSSQGRFLDANYRRAANHHKESTKNANIRFGGGRNHSWMPIIKYLRKRDLDPAIFFCFSKKKCDEAADQLHTQDLTDGATDRNQIHLFYQSAIARLSPTDRNVPQIARHREMLKRGIGVHHAGVLPIIKEITEVLFQQGLIRVLFATETFAMGVNMPARTVVFTAIHKYDSQSHRLLEPGEYIQMAGRAGRRGLDDVGTVLLFPTAADFPVESDVKAVLIGIPKPLRSQFRLTYNMILNLLRIDELRVEDVMARSFSEAPAGRTSGTVKKLLEKGSESLQTMQSRTVELESYRSLHQISTRIDVLSQRIGATLVKNTNNSIKSAVTVGRVVLVRGRDQTLRVGVVIKAPFSGRKKGGFSLKGPTPSLKNNRISTTEQNTTPSLRILVLCGGPAVQREQIPFFHLGLQATDLKSTLKQYNAGGLIVEVRDVQYDAIVALSAIKIDVNERGLVPIRGDPNPVALSSAAETLCGIATSRENWSCFPQLHPVKDLGLQSLDIVEQWDERKQCVSIMNEMVTDLINSGAIVDLETAFERLSAESNLERKLEVLRLATSDESLQLMPDYKQRIEVLNRLGYIDGTNVRLKGRAACEVNTCESLILTELVFEKVLQKLTAVDLAAILCSLVFQEKIDGDETSYSQIDRIREESTDLYDGCQSMLGVLSCLGSAQSDCGLAVSSYEYVRANANFGFLVGVRGWAMGKTFAQICADVGGNVPEGTIVRTVVRLCELLRETKNVGRVIGDPDLQANAEEAMGLVRRDVIFAASLYIQ